MPRPLLNIEIKDYGQKVALWPDLPPCGIPTIRISEWEGTAKRENWEVRKITLFWTAVPCHDPIDFFKRMGLR